jgi:hypothetical protein
MNITNWYSDYSLANPNNEKPADMVRGSVMHMIGHVLQRGDVVMRWILVRQVEFRKAGCDTPYVW